MSHRWLGMSPLPCPCLPLTNHCFCPSDKVVPVPSIFFIANSGTPLDIATGIIANVEELVVKIDKVLLLAGKQRSQVSDSPTTTAQPVAASSRSIAGADDDDDENEEHTGSSANLQPGENPNAAQTDDQSVGQREQDATSEPFAAPPAVAPVPAPAPPTVGAVPRTVPPAAASPPAAAASPPATGASPPADGVSPSAAVASPSAGTPSVDPSAAAATAAAAADKRAAAAAALSSAASTTSSVLPRGNPIVAASRPIQHSVDVDRPQQLEEQRRERESELRRREGQVQEAATRERELQIIQVS